MAESQYAENQRRIYELSNVLTEQIQQQVLEAFGTGLVYWLPLAGNSWFYVSETARQKHVFDDEERDVYLGEIAPDGIVPVHAHIVTELFHVVEGVVEARIGDETRMLQLGDSILIPPHTRHAFKAVGTKAVVIITHMPPIATHPTVKAPTVA